MPLTFEDLVAMDLVLKQADRASQWVATAFHDDIGPHLAWRSKAGLYDSPLEAVFDIWWKALRIVERIGDEVDFVSQFAVTAGGNSYRLDFLLEPRYEHRMWLYERGHDWPKVGVELDGHAFHERTPEQVIYRNQRDRDLQLDGWAILHYSGSELVRDPETIVRECYHKAAHMFWQHKRQIQSTKPAAVERQLQP